LRDRIRGELCPGGGLELQHGSAVEQAHEQPASMNKQAKRRTADVLLPRHLKAGQAHPINVARGTVRHEGHLAVIGNRHRDGVATN